MGFTTAPASDLVAVIGADRILDGVPEEYLRDAAGGLGLQAHADAVVVPRSTEEVAAVVGWCDAHSVPVTPRGGGSGLAGGAVPLEGGVVLSLAGLTAVRNFDPLQWRIEVEAGLATAAVHRLARENGLYFPPDPGAAEQSQIGGNVATNAGGPHAFKYGVTGTWVTGIEIVTAQGEIVQ
ncbi:MAG: FAD-binding oxidoreductase, partial [Actinobacteria bacterium]|nr:FAD-binding oxidoreductase [Actinomycetota bacterium]